MDTVWMLRNGAFSPVSSEKQGGTPSRFTLWGVVNVTPDSFFDGGRYPSFESAFSHARRLAADGARILDLGGASSRPGAGDVPVEDEMRRVLPLVRALSEGRGRRTPPDTLLSVDTWRAKVAAAVLEAGADIINDISACLWEPELSDVLAQYRPGYVLMHCRRGATPGTMQNDPHYDDVVEEVMRFFEERMNAMVKAGLPEENIILDPGIGFGKSAEHNCLLLSSVERLFGFGRPVLLGVSNKSLFGDLLGLDVNRRIESTNVCSALLAARGVAHHRVHDVASARRALTLAEHFTPWKD